MSKTKQFVKLTAQNNLDALIELSSQEMEMIRGGVLCITEAIFDGYGSTGQAKDGITSWTNKRCYDSHDRELCNSVNSCSQIGL